MIEVKDFPYKKAFPPILSAFVEAMATAFGFSCNAVAATMLVAVSIAIGSSKIVRIKSGAEIFPNLFLAIIGDSGSGKTPLLRLILEPILAENSRLISIYNDECEQYKRESKNAKGQDDLSVPRCQQIIANDITSEALIQALYYNPLGVSVYCDELMFWLKSHNKYRNSASGDTQLWLSLYSGTTVTVNRKTDNVVISIPRPCVSLIGSVQPEIFQKAFSGENAENGLLYRFLQVRIEDDCSDALWNDCEFPQQPCEDWDSFLMEIIKMRENSAETEIYELEKDARATILSWASDAKNRIKTEGSRMQMEAFSKYDITAAKVALLLHVMNRNESKLITANEAVFATLICDYFFGQFLIGEGLGYVDYSLTIKQQDFLGSLADVFTTDDAHKVGQALKISQRTVDGWLSRFNGYCINKIEYGIYKKK